MKKGLLLIGLTALVIAVYFLFFNKSDAPQQDPPKDQPLTQSKNSDAFNKPVNDLLNSYFELKDALVNWDTAKATAAAVKVAGLATKIPFNELKADTTIIATAQNFAGSVNAEAEGLVGESTIDGKRHSFYTLSENLYNFLRTVKYDQQVIYHDKCPMAFNDTEEAYWITNSATIVNPYLGNKHPHYAGGMVGCGSIEDSIDFRTK